jgi:hypothetical protein
MKFILSAVKGKITLYDLGFFSTTFFYFVLLPVLVCFFNPDDSGLSPTDLIVTGLAISCLLSFCYFIVNTLLNIPEAVKKFFTATALFLFVMTFFFPSTTGMIDGLKKDLPSDFEVYSNLLKYILILTALLWFVFNQKSAILAKNSLTGCAVFGTAFVLYVWIYGFSYGLEIRKMFWETFEADQKDPAAFIEFGTDKNVIIFVWDGLEGKIAESLFADNLAAQAMFDGFMFFPNAISSAGSTWRSLPIMYSGKFHMPIDPNFNYIRKIMYSDSFFLDAKKNGFKVSCKGVNPTISIGGQKSFENFSRINVKLERRFSSKYIFFLYACNKRVTPIISKRILGFLAKTIRGLSEYLPINGKAIKSKKRHYGWEFLGTIQTDQLRIGNFPNKLSYYHSSVTHEPYNTENGSGYSLKDAQSVYSIALLKATPSLFSKLKQLDIYDSSLIFIVADHGARVSETSAGIIVSDGPFDLSHKGFSKHAAGSYNPLLMVKKPFAKGPLKTLVNPAMLSDIRNVISAYIKGTAIDNETLFNLDDIQKRDIKLIININPKSGQSLDRDIVKAFEGSLQDIPKQLSIPIKAGTAPAKIDGSP